MIICKGYMKYSLYRKNSRCIQQKLAEIMTIKMRSYQFIIGIHTVMKYLNDTSDNIFVCEM